MRIVVVGGNAAGMSAAGRAARLDAALDIRVLERGEHVAYSICGAPYYIAGDVPRIDDLVVYTPERFQERRGVAVCTRVRAEAIETSRRRLLATDLENRREIAYSYDRLLIATGYRAERVEVPGADLTNIFTLASLADAAAIERAAAGARRALVVGGGLVGVEMAETLRRRGLEVTLVEKTDRILRRLDPAMAAIVEEELSRNGVRVCKGRTVRSFFGHEGRVRSAWVEGWAEPIEADLVLVDIGVAPEVSLAESAGIALGRSGAIAVNERMETSSPGIYAAGNCAEALHLVSNRPVFNALGTAANKQGRVAGENLAGRRSAFRGVLDAWVLRVFALAVARTGLTEEDARACGFRCAGARITGRSRSRYFPDAEPITIQALADRTSRKLLGLQAIGGGADKRVDVASVALHGGMTIDEAAQLDLCYAPPYSQVWDPFLVAMNALLKELG